MSLWKREAAWLAIDLEAAHFYPSVGGRSRKTPVEIRANFKQSPSDSAQRVAQAVKKHHAKVGALNIVLSDRLVRYLVVPPVHGLRNADELHQAAIARHAQVFGDDTAHWRVTTDMEISSERHLSCAVELQILESLTQAFMGVGIRIRTIQPAFVAIQRMLHKSVKSLPVWIVAVTGSSITTGYKDAQGWAGVRVHQRVIGGISELVSLLQIDRLYFCPAAMGAQAVWVSGLEAGDDSGIESGEWQLEYLRTPSFLTAEKQDSETLA